MMTTRALFRSGILVLLIALFLGTGCSWFETERLAVRFLNVFPDEPVSLESWDIQALRDDAQLYSIYQEWKIVYEDWLADLGVGIPMVEYLGESDSGVKVLEGGFERAKVRVALTENDYRSGSYQEEERWESSDGESWVVVKEDMLLIGPKDEIMDCVDVIRGRLDSLESNIYVEQVLERLPEGSKVVVGRGDVSGSLLAWAWSYQQEDSDTMKTKAVYLYDGEGAAEIGKSTILNDWEGFYYDTLATQDGEYIEVEALIENDYFRELISE
ncbi:MAG: hypothetical protein SVY53_08080 [Chloroflexota bacterium]|nr:hypothetical protein [Chloroflexota bacterium]